MYKSKIRSLAASTTLLLILLQSACGFNKSGIVNESLLLPSGWKQPGEVIKGSSYSDYVSKVRQEVINSRIPFEAANTETEIGLVSPQEFLPTTQCQQTRGIAILVHGLSDSAFSMHDLARTLSENCYIARTALLPGHGTKPGDLLNTRLPDWIDTVHYLLQQASEEHHHVIAVGFSLGAVLTMAEAIKPDSPVDAIVTVSPAFYLTTSPYAELTRWIAPFKRWLDKEAPDDTYRYEAIPTVAVVETVKAIRRFHRLLDDANPINLPWLLVQSVDDLVVRTRDNEQLFIDQAKHPESLSITFVGKMADLANSNSANATKDGRLLKVAGYNEQHRVSGLTHVAIHQAPDNSHYGENGDYRNCGVGGPRKRSAVQQCQQAEDLWSGPWNGKAPDNGAYAISTYNPNYDLLARYLSKFLTESSAK